VTGTIVVATVGIALPIVVGLWLMPRSEGEPPLSGHARQVCRLYLDRLLTAVRQAGAFSAIRQG
jgi:hypothetical protein